MHSVINCGDSGARVPMVAEPRLARAQTASTVACPTTFLPLNWFFFHFILNTCKQWMWISWQNSILSQSVVSFWDPHQGLCPWTSLGARPQTPFLSSRFKLTFRRLSASPILLGNPQSLLSFIWSTYTTVTTVMLLAAASFDQSRILCTPPTPIRQNWKYQTCSVSKFSVADSFE